AARLRRLGFLVQRLRDAGGPAGIAEPEHGHFERFTGAFDGQRFAAAQHARRLRALPVHLDLAGADRLAREAARPVEPRRPQPEVEAYRVRRLLRGGGGGFGGGLGLGVAGQVFLDARLAALEATQVVQLAGADRAAALHLDRVDRGAVALEHALHAVAVRDLAHGERGVQAGVLLGDDHAFVGLDALAVAFLDLDVDDDGIAGAEHRQLALRLFGLEVLQQRVERGLVHGDGLCVALLDAGRRDWRQAVVARVHVDPRLGVMGLLGPRKEPSRAL